MISLDNYREQVRQAITRRDGKPLLNGTADHAAIIIQEAFKNAKNNVRILSSKLSPECYAVPEVLENAKYFFLDNNHTAQILIEKNDPINWTEHPFIKYLNDYISPPSGNPKLEIRFVPQNVSATYPYNFLLLDNYGYRYESDRNGRAATAAFLPEGNTKNADHLASIFAKIWSVSPTLQQHMAVRPQHS